MGGELAEAALLGLGQPTAEDRVGGLRVAREQRAADEDLRGLVRAAHEGPRRDEREAHRLALAGERVEARRLDVPVDRRVLRATGRRYCPRVTTSTPAARRSRIVSSDLVVGLADARP